ncbi:hypothetical protein EV683_11558 [Crenobacter luteus]|uniref:Cof-type HAD-IIB family hydrolase n=1 Tax=Crenobacter luteus TaxID=1452487 RepID=UPI0010527255|nr:Cof-type HAD-IIB family hydrolase [Crenobacter luteus]TCP11141.1 hypothetical protein EV683_11558 [Crenobacter luteus]
MYAAIACDLDGTLLNAANAVSAFTADTLREAARRGARLVIATGRHVADARAVAEALGVPASLITTNGARVHDADGALLYRDDVAAEQVRELVQPALARGTMVSLYRDDGRLCCRHDGYVHRYDDDFGEPHATLAQHPGDGVAKVMYTGHPARLAEIETAIRARFGDTVALTYSQIDFLEVMAPGVSKGRALTRLLARHGVEPADCAAFGDGLNDLDMLGCVGHPFRMANANPRLAELLPGVPEAGHHHEDGVAHALRRALGF